MKIIKVTLPKIAPEEYSINIGENIIEKIPQLVNFDDYSQIAIVTDSNVKKFLLPLERSLSLPCLVITLLPGENNKTIKSIETIWQKLADAKFDRKSLIINLGGGVICDIGGFAASTYMRGIDFLNIPTTLLCQVDASVGGKTGIDYAGLKNLIGTFKQPIAVVIDINTLETLPKRELISGFAEIIKHGLIHDKKYFYQTTEKSPLVFSQGELAEIIARSCEIKKEIVEKDPKENGIRKILNFGHTIGHAIEALSLETEKPLLHGEAISLGIIAEAKLSQLNNYILQSDVELIKENLKNAGLPTSIKSIDKTKIIEKIAGDKKSSFGKIKWTLLRKIGEAICDVEVDEELIKEAIDYVS